MRTRFPSRITLITFTCAFALVIALLPHTTLGNSPQASASVPSIQDGFNGLVHDTVTSDGIQYVAGNFTAYGPQTGGGALVDSTTGTLDRTFPDFEGEARVAVPDGSGGMFVGGGFSSVGGHETGDLVHIRPDGTVNTDFQVFINGADGTVYSLALDEVRGVLYVGGSFECFGTSQFSSSACDASGEVQRINIAALQVSDGAVLPWNPLVVEGGIVSSIAVHGSSVFVGGTLEFVGDEDRDYLAEIDASTGLATTWDPSPNGFVAALTISGDTLYVGGEFESIDSQVRHRVASFDLSSDPNPYITSWDPVANDDVLVIKVDSGIAYLGGRFTNVGGESRNGLAAVSATSTDDVNSWDPQPGGGGAYDGTVSDLAVIEDNVYFVGNFTTVGASATPRSRAAAVSKTDSTSIADWNPNPDGVSSLSLVAEFGDKVLIGGDFSTINVWQARSQLASLNSDGSLTSWAPTVSGGYTVSQLSVVGNNLYILGDFTSVNTVTRKGLAALEIPSGALTAWNPDANDQQMHSMSFSNEKIYVAGNFTTVGGESRSGLAAVDLNTGAVDPNWNPNEDGSSLNWAVDDLLVSGDAVYVGGSFTSIGGVARKLIAALHPDTGEVLPWDPKLDGRLVTQIGIVGDTIVFGGSVTCINTVTVGGLCNDTGAGEVPLQGMGGASALTGAPAPGWIHRITNGVDLDTGLPYAGSPRAFVTAGGVTYMGGEFTELDGQTVGGVAAFTGAGSVIDSWRPIANGGINGLEIRGSSVFLSGGFSRVNGQMPRYLQSVNSYSPPQPAPDPDPGPTPASETSSPTSTSTSSPTPSVVGPTVGGSIPSSVTQVNSITRKPLGGGVVRVSSAQADKAKPTRNTKSPSRTLADAPAVSVRIKTVIKLTTRGLPRNAIMQSQIQVKGKWVNLGPVNTNGKGFAVLPAFAVSVPGNYPVRLTNTRNQRWFIDVEASRRT